MYYGVLFLPWELDSDELDEDQENPTEEDVG